MRKAQKTKLVATLAVLAPLVLASCGGNDDSGADVRKGGSIRVGTTGPDSFDPVLAQSIQAYQPLQLVYTPLLTYKDGAADGSELIPGLAEAMPQVTDGGKTYRLRLRRGLHYTDGSPVRASDFEHSVKRALALGSPWSSFYSGIVGADAFSERGGKEGGDIGGIEASDRTGEITIHLTEPDGTFPNVLAFVYTAPTPAAKSPFKSLTGSPPPGLGRYTIEVVNPSQEFVLTRNEHFDLEGIEPGRVRKITAVVRGNVARLTQDVIDGRLDFSTENVTGDLLPTVRSRYGDRYREDPNPPNIYYFFMNVRTEPFDSRAVREAVNYAVDSRALVRLFGGRLRPTCNFLPPGVPGYEPNEPCPFGDPNGPGDIEKARSLVERSGRKGMKVTVWGYNTAPQPAVADYYRDLLDRIGFEAETKILNDRIYFQAVGNQKTKAQTGLTNWLQDFPNPADFFGPLVSGEAIQETNNLNLSNSDDPDVNEKIAELKRTGDLERTAGDWADLDREVVENAYNAPYGNEESSTFFSERMDFENCAGVHPVYGSNWARFCLK